MVDVTRETSLRISPKDWKYSPREGREFAVWDTRFSFSVKPSGQITDKRAFDVVSGWEYPADMAADLFDQIDEVGLLELWIQEAWQEEPKPGRGHPVLPGLRRDAD